MSITTTQADDPPKTLKFRNPATLKPLPELKCHSPEQIDKRLEHLHQAAASYNHSTVRERIKLVRKFRKALARSTDALVESIGAETGKKRHEALIEIFAALEVIRNGEKIAQGTLKRRYRTPRTLIHKRGYVDYQPWGVAAVILPWNYPMILASAPAAEALLAGNCVVLKPSEQTSHTSLLVKEIFDEATGRPELLDVVIGYGNAGEHIINSNLTHVVCFTGSTNIGKQIAAACGAMLKPVILELGGKDAMLVMADANLKRAAKSAVWGGFTNAGQTCIAVERIYVEQAVYEPFLELLRKEAGELTTGSNHDDAIGPVTVEVQYDIIEAHRKDAIAKGATVESFGEPDGRHIPPFLVTHADHTMSITQDETFGPQLAVIAVADEDEAIRMTNDSRFGLSAYIFTGSAKRGRRMARRIQAGVITVNDVIVQYGYANLPFGGFGDSGLGKLHGPEGLISFSRQQAVVESRLDLPMELWWYDLGSKTYGLMSRFIRTWYS